MAIVAGIGINGDRGVRLVQHHASSGSNTNGTRVTAGGVAVGIDIPCQCDVAHGSVDIQRFTNVTTGIGRSIPQRHGAQACAGSRQIQVIEVAQRSLTQIGGSGAGIERQAIGPGGGTADVSSTRGNRDGVGSCMACINAGVAFCQSYGVGVQPDIARIPGDIGRDIAVQRQGAANQVAGIAAYGDVAVLGRDVAKSDISGLGDAEIAQCRSTADICRKFNRTGSSADGQALRTACSSVNGAGESHIAIGGGDADIGSTQYGVAAMVVDGYAGTTARTGDACAIELHGIGFDIHALTAGAARNGHVAVQCDYAAASYFGVREQ